MSKFENTSIIESMVALIKSASGKDLCLNCCDHDPKLMEVEWECNHCHREPDLFEKLIERSDVEGRPRSPPHNEDQLMVDGEAAAPRQGCKCSKIGCLKLYCECFAKGLVCGAQCICTGCQNCAGNESKIHVAQQMANFRKPGSFKGVKPFVPERKCTCKKSQCLKKYCECHNAGMKCSASCLCTDCHNRQPYSDFGKPQNYVMQIETEA